ncbi:sigma-70 family RNA polymerase sigma factor [Lyngbya confervoides]|uniref:Sigma-70 family RNA polymerase sigma factor n=1 Tax=Lyngbya confervoides BDU141951 TaxID=1574623 RepID=A0ABD4SYM0_9CYAN|nr:sigma-70 family RNA polymerase sigma factor [Lyngbya confervoides]MCM1981546.1 sigma-70 family RNA polymerase sigma factor [Lyngbya confervoides BDU141951]
MNQKQEGYEALLAYLQEPCYQAAVKVHQGYQQRLSHTLFDYFGWGTVHVPRLLQDFQPELNPDLARYAYSILQNRILDELRMLDRSLGYTQWSLLLHVSERRLRQALARAGMAEPTPYLQVWQLYRQLGRSPQMRHQGKVREPSRDLLRQILTQYQQQFPDAVSLDQMSRRLQEAAVALKTYLSMPERSLNAPIDASSETELGGILPDPGQDWDEALDRAELEAQYQALSDWLSQEICQIQPSQYRLNPQIFTMLERYYGAGLTQTEISQELGVNQSTVGRNLAKFEEILAARLIPWAEDHLATSISPDRISPLCEALEQWLQTYYQEHPSLPQE